MAAGRKRRRLAWGAVTLALLTASIVGLPGSSLAGKGTHHRGPTTISPGVTYLKKNIVGPNQIKIVRVELGSAATLDVALAGNTLPRYLKTSTMAQNHNAVVAVNGDFGVDPGRPGHAIAEDGTLLQTSPLGADGKNFAVRFDKTAAFIGGQNVRVKINDPSATDPINVDLWNDDDPGPAEIAGYTTFGGSVSKPPKNACSARLVTAGPPEWPASDGVRRPYTVNAQSCGSTAMTLGSGLVISTPSTGPHAAEISELDVGETVQLTWTLGWPNVLDTIGGSPVLIEDNQIVVDNCNSYLCDRHPRTAVGIYANGDIMIFQVDGRSSVSEGMTLLELAREMKNRGAVWALNLDGGGSSTMWIQGQGIVNNPSDGVERSVTNALLVLPGADSGDPVNMESAAVGPVAPTAPEAALTPAQIRRDRAARRAALQDPGSTGGLLDAVESGQI